ncbi:MAG: hypothetical protein KDC92_15835 [Bacteroidetes bacterium]|nr:hypothetical protein [Bacteroidota bacterium]
MKFFLPKSHIIASNENNCGQMESVVKCIGCNKEHRIVTNAQKYVDWLNGELINNALPELNAEQKELLISGTCNSCWDLMWGEEED